MNILQKLDSGINPPTFVSGTCLKRMADVTRFHRAL